MLLIHLHLAWRNGPQSFIQRNLIPLCLSRFGGPTRTQDLKLKQRFRGLHRLAIFDLLQDISHLIIMNGSKMRVTIPIFRFRDILYGIELNVPLFTTPGHDRGQTLSDYVGHIEFLL